MKAVLIEVGQILGAFKGKFAVVGGAVPWLLLNNEDMPHVGTLLDLRVGFEIDRHWRVALTVNNVLDKTYYETVGADDYAWYGEPRNFMLRVDARY